MFRWIFFFFSDCCLYLDSIRNAPIWKHKHNQIYLSIHVSALPPPFYSINSFKVSRLSERFLRSFSANSIDNRRSYLPHKIFIYFISLAYTSSDAGKLMTMIRMENCHSHALLLAFISGNLQNNISLDDSSSDGWKIKWIKHSISGRGIFFSFFRFSFLLAGAEMSRMLRRT